MLKAHSVLTLFGLMISRLNGDCIDVENHLNPRPACLYACMRAPFCMHALTFNDVEST